ncbi:uncharacterized protein LOC112589668, partial [Harpegnathos saltator]|uniref:uncharacterized protein LOC112589668 n=1 Tax=Harpegnathos saltator TaxID=610380 RepID=UPI000DBED2DF
TLSNRNPDIVAARNANSRVAATRRDVERPVGREKVAGSSTRSDVYYDGSTRPTALDYRTRKRRQVLLDSNRRLPRRAKGHRNHQVYPGSQRDNIDRVCEFHGERPHVGESKKTRSASRLKVIVRKMYLEDCGCPTLSRPVVTRRLPVPCKPNDLIGRIFEAEPSLAESCLILMRRKFQANVSSVCSCLNDVLGRLNVETSRLITLYLSCEIRPGYISFKLKTDGAGSAHKYLFVARIPICQNVHKRTAISRDSAATKATDEVEGLKRSGRCEDNASFNDLYETLRNIDEKCSERKVVHDNAPERDCELATSSPEESSEKIVETAHVTSYSGDPEERNEEHGEALDSSVIDRGESRLNGRIKEKRIPEADDSVAKNDESAQLASCADCACLPSEDSAERKLRSDEVEGIFSKDPDRSSSRSAELDKRGDWTCSSKESDSRSADCSRITSSSVGTFAQNSEHDKQLVELSCNRFSDDAIQVQVDERSREADADSLNSATVAAIGCDSNCRCGYDDFIDITVVDDTAEEDDTRLALETLRDNPNAAQPRSAIRRGPTKVLSRNNDSLTTSVRTSRLKVSSKGINVDVSYPRSRLASAGDESTSSAVTNGKDLPAPPEGDAASANMDESVCRTPGGTQRGFSRPLKRRAVSKARLRSNAHPRHPRAETRADPRAGDCFASLASDTSHSFRSPATSEAWRDASGRSRESRKLRLRYVRASSSNGVRNVTSVTTIRYRATPREARDGRPAFATDRLRESVGRSVRWMKSLIRGKLAEGELLERQRVRTTRTFRGCEQGETGGDIAGRTTAERYVGQGYCVTPCSNSHCRGRGYTTTRVESSDVTLPRRRNRGKERSEGGMKLRDRRLAGGSEVLSSFSSIDTTYTRSYDLLTLAAEDWQARRLDDGSDRRHLGRGAAEDERGLVSRSKHCHGRDCGNHEKSRAISSRSAVMSLADDVSARHLEPGASKRRRATLGGERERDRRASEKRQHPAGRCGDRRKKPIGYAAGEFSELSWSSFIRMNEARDARARGRSHGASKSRNASGLSPLGKNRETLDGDTEMDRLRRRRAFALSTDTCHDLESTLSRYVQLCRNVKRSLMKMLWLDDIHEVSTTATRGSDS